MISKGEVWAFQFWSDVNYCRFSCYVFLSGEMGWGGGEGEGAGGLEPPAFRSRDFLPLPVHLSPDSRCLTCK